jgi:membrane protease YdiL (CAAX protease family)
VTTGLIAVGLVAYNNLLNLWPPFHRWAYVPLNLAVSALIALVGLTVLDLTPADLGFARPETALIGAGAGFLVAAPLLAALISSRWSRYIADPRFANDSNAMTALRMMIRVPIGTALLEELAFRGVLLAISMPLGTAMAALINATTFGLWHVIPTVNTARTKRPGISSTKLRRAVVGGVLFTSVGALGFVWLRIQTRSLAAPFAFHATLNSLATLAATIAARSSPGIVNRR